MTHHYYFHKCCPYCNFINCCNQLIFTCEASMNLLIIQDLYLKKQRLYRINFHSIRFYHRFNIPWPPSPLPRLLLSEHNGCIGGREGVSECKIIRSVFVTAHFIPLQMDFKNIQTMFFFKTVLLNICKNCLFRFIPASFRCHSGVLTVHSTSFRFIPLRFGVW